MTQIQKHGGDIPSPPEQPQIIVYQQPEPLATLPKGHWLTTDAGKIFAAGITVIAGMAACLMLATVAMSISVVFHGPGVHDAR